MINSLIITHIFEFDFHSSGLIDIQNLMEYLEQSLDRAN